MGRRELILAALGLAAPGAAQSTDVFAGIPGVGFTYYDVGGDDPEAIQRSMAANRVVDPHDGTHTDAVSNWYYSWRGKSRAVASGCTVSDVRIGFVAIVRLPRLLSHVTPDLKARWDGYIAAVERHEAGHVRYAWEHRGDLANAIRAARCGRADAAAKAVIARIDAWQARYDIETQHGKTQGAVIP